MKRLQDLLEKLDYKCLQGNMDVEISGVIYDSRKVCEDCLFICIKGANFDGHDYAAQVAEKAKVLVVSREVPELKGMDVTVIQVEDTRYAMAFISAAYFEYCPQYAHLLTKASAFSTDFDNCNSIVSSNNLYIVDETLSKSIHNLLFSLNQITLFSIK